MPSLSSKDRVSLCRFTFEDGRRCRTPRISTSPDFCFYHAKKEAQLRANEKLAEDLAYFFSGDYLSANDLNTALSRVFVAVARGELKPRAARTLAYLAQTMFQTLHLAQNEFITACGENDWRETVVTSINDTHDYRFPQPTEPPAPPKPATPPQACHPERSEGPRLDSAPSTNAETRPTRATPPTPPKPATPPQACHPERSEGSRLDPASPTAADTRPAPATPPPPAPHNPSSRTGAGPQPGTPERAQSVVPSRLQAH
jgi:hypothetical protein